ncbi:ABC-2 transporter permease [Anaerocolumna xylanovorans]|uniref:ABC-2 family transporter protein n=1 Tax=Anaerocolumna xylanovorans DSM 12503 TaxID=1121345 RepID=A0A1M7YIL0_9FIRM|nr:ABC-2 transporter permease [Anaerocolumna xylanovorans]SHO52436.1 ABC-2 family transporter protein [Anaerocolumna xylanovorans DSM 12503]
MLFQLVRKDFLLVKKYVLIMITIYIIFPLFLVWRLPEYAGILGFVLITIYSVFMLLQYVSLKETQYPKASALLCALPYPRKDVVLSRYIFCLIIYLVCCLVFGIETLMFPRLGTFGFTMPVMLFLVISLILSIYLPVHYKLGFEKTKIFFIIIIMASSFAFPQFIEIKSGIYLSFLDMLSPTILLGGVILFSIIILAVSATISMQIYKKADL